MLAIVGIAFAAMAGAASAQSTGARPVIVIGQNATDPTKLPWIGDDARKALAADLTAYKAGKEVAFVFAAAPDGKNWSITRALTEANYFGVEDLARASLDTCEYLYGAPCFILSINGRDAQDPSTGWPLQPRMITRRGGIFDAARVPFVSSFDRASIAGYGTSTASRALIITTTGGWLWRSGDTVLQAIATVQAECQKTYPNATCVLYAVNDRVIFAP
jgi:hypothetical protein